MVHFQKFHVTQPNQRKWSQKKNIFFEKRYFSIKLWKEVFEWMNLNEIEHHEYHETPLYRTNFFFPWVFDITGSHGTSQKLLQTS